MNNCFCLDWFICTFAEKFKNTFLFYLMTKKDYDSGIPISPLLGKLESNEGGTKKALLMKGRLIKICLMSIAVAVAISLIANFLVTLINVVTNIAFYGEDTNIARRLKAAGKVKFVMQLPMHTSARRLHAEGLMAMALKYGANFLGEVVLKRPVTDRYDDVR